MGLLKRISNVIRSNVNDLIDQAEDPRKIIEQTIADMQAEEKKVKGKLVEVMALLKKTEAAQEQAQAKSADWEQKAMTAVKAGNDELARKALEEKQTQDNLVQEHQAGIAQQHTYVEELKKGMAALSEKVEEAKRKRNELIARLNAAEAQKRTQATEGLTKDHLADSTAFDTFDRMAEKIGDNEAQSAAMMDLVGDEAKAQQAEQEVEALFEAQENDDALAALKAKMAGRCAGQKRPHRRRDCENACRLGIGRQQSLDQAVSALT